MTDLNFSRIRKLYPECIPFDELCAMLHYSKRKVKWMLDQDWIKHETFNRKTWKYRIPTESFLDYLILSQKRPDLYKFPKNCFSSHIPFANVGTPRTIFNDPDMIASTLRLLWRNLPDILSMKQIRANTGFSYERIQHTMARNNVNVLTLHQTIYFNKEEAIQALSHPISMRRCDYTKEMQDIYFAPKEGSHE